MGTLGIQGVRRAIAQADHYARRYLGSAGGLVDRQCIATALSPCGGSEARAMDVVGLMRQQLSGYSTLTENAMLMETAVPTLIE